MTDMERGRAALFSQAAETFTRKVQQFTSVLEVALTGSLAAGDPWPGDVDLALALQNLDGLVGPAKAARQISFTTHAWDVFVFGPGPAYLGRLCHRRDCPTRQARCDAIDCGQTPYLGNLPDFRFDPIHFLGSPLRLLFQRGPESIFLAWRIRLGVGERPPEAPLEPLRLDCVACGRSFLFGVGEQKHFRRMGFQPPRRCTSCRSRADTGYA